MYFSRILDKLSSCRVKKEKKKKGQKKKGASCLLHNTLDQSLNLRPKLAIFSLALADLVGTDLPPIL